jgi:hypothetical protein
MRESLASGKAAVKRFRNVRSMVLRVKKVP